MCSGRCLTLQRFSAAKILTSTLFVLFQLTLKPVQLSHPGRHTTPATTLYVRSRREGRSSLLSFSRENESRLLRPACHRTSAQHLICPAPCVGCIGQVPCGVCLHWRHTRLGWGPTHSLSKLTAPALPVAHPPTRNTSAHNCSMPLHPPPKKKAWLDLHACM